MGLRELKTAEANVNDNLVLLMELENFYEQKNRLADKRRIETKIKEIKDRRELLRNTQFLDTLKETTPNTNP